MLQNSSTHIRKYLDLIEKKYDVFRYHSDRITLSMIDSLCFSHIEKGIIADDRGFALLFCDDRISQEVGCIGFFETYIASAEKDFIEIIMKRAKELWYKRLIAPINLSIWWSYRFAHESPWSTISGEYLTDPDYPRIFLQAGFRKYEGYITAYRENNPFLTLDKDAKNLEIGMIPKDMQNEIIFWLSSSLFLWAPKISREEFEIYMQIYRELYKETMHIFGVKYNGSYVGFASTFYEEDKFIVKTIGILNPYQGKWYGNHLLSHIHSFYENLGIKKAYYLYMRESGDALNLTHENAQIHRTYSTYILNI